MSEGVRDDPIILDARLGMSQKMANGRTDTAESVPRAGVVDRNNNPWGCVGARVNQAAAASASLFAAPGAIEQVIIEMPMDILEGPSATGA